MTKKLVTFKVKPEMDKRIKELSTFSGLSESEIIEYSMGAYLLKTLCEDFDSGKSFWSGDTRKEKTEMKKQYVAERQHKNIDKKPNKSHKKGE